MKTTLRIEGHAEQLLNEIIEKKFGTDAQYKTNQTIIDLILAYPTLNKQIDESEDKRRKLRLEVLEKETVINELKQLLKNVYSCLSQELEVKLALQAKKYEIAKVLDIEEAPTVERVRGKGGKFEKKELKDDIEYITTRLKV